MAQKDSSVKPDLAKLVKFWQRRIRHLRGWEITALYVGDSDHRMAIDGCPCYGLNTYDADTMVSVIFIRDPEEPGAVDSYGVEQTLLHELAHLILDLPVEVACNTIADALYLAYPKRKKRTND